jgi:son of sevenless-like protein
MLPTTMAASSGSPGPVETQGYDWLAEENYGKWRGIFVPALQKVLQQVHPNLVAREDALEYVENLIVRLLAMLTAKPTPVSVQDVEDRVTRTFPTPIDRWALSEAQSAVEKGRKKSCLVLPVEKVHPILAREVLQNRVDDQVTLYIVAVLEYISADILKLAGNYVKNIRHIQISRQDIKVAMCADKVLMDMFYQDEVPYIEEEGGTRRAAQTYDEVVKDLILNEKAYLRDLHMITKVFREQLQKLEFATTQELDSIFSNITDIAELTMTLIGSLEDTLEMAEDGQVSAIGSCFEELAEAEEFDVYDKFARDVLSPSSRLKLDILLSKPEVSDKLQSSGHGFREAVKFYLPKLILGPVFHCFHYFKYIELLTKLTPYKEDQDSLEQVSAMLTPLQNKLTSAATVSQVVGPIGAGITGKRKASDVFHRYVQFISITFFNISYKYCVRLSSLYAHILSHVSL